MSDENATNKVESNTNPADEKPPVAEQGSDDGEFKITVRKLEMPVRPRGVLAE